MLKLLRRFVDRLIGMLQAEVLFPSKPTIHFYPNIRQCPECAKSFHVQKTVTKTVVTMDIGAFWAKRTVMYCPHHREKIFSSDRLRRLVPKGGAFGFDVIVESCLKSFYRTGADTSFMLMGPAKGIVPIYFAASTGSRHWSLRRSKFHRRKKSC